MGIKFWCQSGAFFNLFDRFTRSENIIGNQLVVLSVKNRDSPASRGADYTRKTTYHTRLILDWISSGTDHESDAAQHIDPHQGSL